MSGERLQDHWSSGLQIADIIIVQYNNITLVHAMIAKSYSILRGSLTILINKKHNVWT